jgi:hypothetical protein
MNLPRSLFVTLLCVVASSVTPTAAGQFLIDLNDQEGSAAGWDVFPSLAQGVAYPLTDKSGSGDADVTLMSVDDNFNPNNPDPPRTAATYDGILVPQEARDDYLFKQNDAAGTTARLRIDNLNPGPYNVTVFEGRTTDPSQMAKIWVGDTNGSNEPAGENTGNFGGGSATVQVDVAGGQTLWYMHLEDNTGGLSGIIINPVPEPNSLILWALAALPLATQRRRRGTVHWQFRQ